MTQLLGAIQAELPRYKSVIDFWLSRFPRVYRFVEDRRRWTSWDRRVYLSLIERGDVIADIGANVGGHTVLFSHLAGKNGKVMSFEPIPANLSALEQTLLARQRYDNVTVVPAALGNPAPSQSRAVINLPVGDLTQASLAVQSTGSWSGSANVQQMEIQISSLDAEVARLGVDTLDFVKVDVEGAEREVIFGGAAALRRYKPILYCEVFKKWTTSFGYSPADLFHSVQDLGYTEARVISDGTVLRVAIGAPPEDLFDVSCDVIFCTPDRIDRLRRFDLLYGSAWR